jgi:hypothetical protein
VKSGWKLKKADAMHRWVRLLFFALAVKLCGLSVHAAEPIVLSQELIDAGWMSLFDGRLMDWGPRGDAKWQVVDDTIYTSGDKPGFLMRSSSFRDFELHIEFRSATNTNSGVFFSSRGEPTNPIRDCYELNIAPADNPFPTGSLVGRKKVSLAGDGFPAADQWHTFDVTARGGRWTVWLDGRKVLEYVDLNPLRRSHIGLQSNQGEVAFRNIRIREIRGE